jgi:hypothetical protein
LAAWADWNCATGELREALRQLPDQVYISPEQLLGLFEAAAWREAQISELVRN